MRNWRRSGGLGPSAVGGGGLLVVEVSVVGPPDTDLHWRFSGPVTVTVNVPELEVQTEGDEWIGPETTVQDGDDGALAVYGEAIEAGAAWRLLTDPATIPEAIQAPQAGSVVEEE